MDKDIDNLGRQMPYTVPEGFFEASAASIRAAVQAEQRKRHRATIVRWSLGAAAAAAIAVTTLIALRPATTPTPSSTLIAQETSDQMLTSMSDDDLDMMIAINNSDEFLYCDDDMQDYY